jgi:hypothetical protein
VHEDGCGTWYERAFADAYEPRLLFLVHTAERRRKVETAVNHALGRLPPREFRVLVVTLDEGPRVLAPYVAGGTLPPAGARPQRVVALDETLLPTVRDGFNAVADAYNATRRVIADHNARGGAQLVLPPAPSEALRVVRDFLTLVLASSRRVDSGGPRATTG